MKRIETEDVKAALQTILRSETFARSERSRDLLEYLVSTKLAGEADRLKGFAIAVDVFGRGNEFDASTESVVRVQAGRLRSLLESYYALEGCQDRVRIKVPKGSYVPEFELTEAAGKDQVELPVAAVAEAPAEEEPAEGESLKAKEQGETAPAPELSATPGVAAAPAPASDNHAAYTDYVRRNIRFFWIALYSIILLLAAVLIMNIWSFSNFMKSSSDDTGDALRGVAASRAELRISHDATAADIHAKSGRDVKPDRGNG